MNSYLDRMRDLGMTQVQLIFLLRDQGVIVQPPELSQMLRGVNTYPKTKRVLAKVSEILADAERARE